ncbi:MAG TPA: hypothetical protein PLN69_11600, partial [bacterium]|nr:hypothetical protein [bacterium]
MKETENNNTAKNEKLEPLRGTSLWRDAFRRLIKNKMAVFGALVILFITTIALLTPYIAPYGFEEIHLTDGNRPPSFWEDMNCGGNGGGDEIYCRSYRRCSEGVNGEACRRYALGTDHLGRDILTRIMYGSRVSLMVG